MPRPSHSSRFYHPNNFGCGVQIIKLDVGSIDGKCNRLYRAVWNAVCSGVREVGEAMKKGKIVDISGPEGGCYVILEPGKGRYNYYG